MDAILVAHGGLSAFCILLILHKISVVVLWINVLYDVVAISFFLQLPLVSLLLHCVALKGKPFATG